MELEGSECGGAKTMRVTAVSMAIKTKAAVSEEAEETGILEVKSERFGGSCSTQDRKRGILHNCGSGLGRRCGVAELEHIQQRDF